MAIVETPAEKKLRGIIPAIQFGHMASPALLMKVNYSTFEHSPEELGKLITMKKKNKEERKKHYGEKANKYLNIPSRTVGTLGHFTF